jgi:hypothetical protein
MVLLADGSGENAGDTRVDRVAALSEESESGFDFDVIRRAHHLAGAPDRWEHSVSLARGLGRNSS